MENFYIKLVNETKTEIQGQKMIQYAIITHPICLI